MAINKYYGGNRNERVDDASILAWLSPLNFETTRDEYLANKLPGTGDWFLELQELKDWIAGSSKSPILWCYGLCGIGRTTMTSILIKHLEQELHTPQDALAYFYTRDGFYQEKSVLSILSSICKQLAAQCERLPWQLVRMYSQMVTDGIRPDIDEVMLLIMSMCDSFSRVFIIIDDLAEISRNSDRRILIPKLEWLRNHGARILVASTTHGDRPERCDCTTDIEDAFIMESKLEIRPHKQDLAVYVLNKLGEHTGREALFSRAGITTDSFVENIVESTVGIYAVIDIFMERRLREIEDGVPAGSEPTLSSEEFDEFQREIFSIKQQSPPRVKLAMALISWVSYAKRPLSALELLQAVFPDAPPGIQFSFRNGDLFMTGEFGEQGDEIAGSITIGDFCKGLIYMAADETVLLSQNRRLSESQRQELFPFRHAAILYDCLEIINSVAAFEMERYPFNADPENLQRQLNLTPFLGYCRKYWIEHLSDCENTYAEEGVHYAAIDYLRNLYRRPACWVEERKPMFDQAYHALVTDDETPIIKVARLGMNRFGMDRLLERLIKTGEYDINAVSYKRETALSVAVMEGHVSTARLLYRYGASVHHRDEYGNSLLHMVAEKDDEVMATLLIYSGLMPDEVVGPREFETPLYVAASKNNTRVGKVFLKYGKNISGALQAAARAGSLEFVRLLVEHGCKLQDPSSSLLGEAIRSGYVELVKYMVENGADACEQDSRRYTPIHIVSQYPNLDIFKILIAQGADPFALNDGPNEVCEGDSAMSHVIWKGEQEIVEYLLPMLKSNRSVSIVSLIQMTAGAARVGPLQAQLFDIVLERIPGRMTDWPNQSRYTLLNAVISSSDEQLLPKILLRGTEIDTTDEQEWTCLHLNSSHGNLKKVELLFQHGADPNSKTKYGMTPLHVASYKGSVECCQILLKHGAQLEALASDGSTPLLVAANESRKDMVLFLLSQGANVNAMTLDGETALHYAILDENVELVQALLDCGVDVSVQARRGGTPLHLASGKGFVEIVEKLINHKYNLMQPFQYHGGRFDPPEEYDWNAGVLWNQLGIRKQSRPIEDWIIIEKGWTPLHVAVASNHVDIVERLLDAGADISSKGSNGETPIIVAASACVAGILDMLLKRGAQMHDTTAFGNSALHSVAESSVAKQNASFADRFKCACKLRHEAEEAHGHEDHSKIDCVELLMEHHADFMLENHLGQTPLALAVQAGNGDVVKIFIEKIFETYGSVSKDSYTQVLEKCGPDVDANVLRLVADVIDEPTETQSIWTALISEAAVIGNHDLVMLGLAKGGVCATKTSDGRNPFLEAIKNEHAITVKLLLEAGSNPMDCDEQGRSALHLACHVSEKNTESNTLTVVPNDRSKEHMVRELILLNPDINARAHDGNTPLHFAIATGRSELVRGLVQCNISVHIRNNRGETPLHWAVSTWIFPDIVEHLLRRGACASAQDLEGYTPLHKIRERRVEGSRAVELLMKNGADPLTPARNGDLAIHSAIKRGNRTLFDALADLSSTITMKGSKGRTALHMAAAGKGRTQFIEPLVKRGADLEAVDDRGWTPLHYAVKNGDMVTIDELLKHGKPVGKTSLTLRVATGAMEQRVQERLISAGYDLEDCQ